MSQIHCAIWGFKFNFYLCTAVIFCHKNHNVAAPIHTKMRYQFRASTTMQCVAIPVLKHLTLLYIFLHKKKAQ